MFARLINMAKTPDEVKKDVAMDCAPTVGGKVSAPMYPWGLAISLEDDALAKLGLAGDMPDVGDIVQFNAIAKVTSVSQNEREGTDGTKSMCCRVELQITDMGIPGTNEADRSEEKSQQRRKRFYGSSTEAMGADTDD